MIKGTWFDSFAYEGEDPASEVDCEVCNGQVFTNEELTEVIKQLETMATLTTSEPTRDFLNEVIVKAQFGIEASE